MDIAFGWSLDGRCHPLSANGAIHALGQPVLGPQGLLSLLETVLGLTRPHVPAAVRIARTQARLRALDDGKRFYSASFARDSWATARQVLTWRDSLFAAGWTGEPVPDGGARLDTLAEMEAADGVAIGASAGERLQGVLTCLAGSPPLDLTRVRLVTPVEQLPPLWRSVIQQLENRGVPVEGVPDMPPSAGDLGAIQAALSGGMIAPFTGDGSFVVIDTDDEWQAADAVASWLAAGDNADLVMVRGVGAPVLDDACHRLGLPRPGSAESSSHRSVLQVLPLALEILWEPLNAARLLEFLTLPRSPLPGFVARRFTRALMAAPGTGGEEWNAAWQDCLDENRRLNADGLSEAEIAKRQRKDEDDWRFWLQPRRFRPEDGLHTTVIQQVCRYVAQWAAGIGNQTGDRLFLTAAAHAYGLGEAVASLGITSVSAVQLGRIVDAVTTEGVAAPESGGEAAPWLAVDSPGRIWGAAETVLWWNFTDTISLPSRPPWSRAELAALARNDVVVEPMEAEILRQAAAWRQALINARSRLILVKPRRVRGETVPPHPLWHEIFAHLETMKADAMAMLPASSISTHDQVSWAGRTVQRQGRDFVALPSARRTWRVPATFFGRRDKESISSIEKLITCPLAWSLNYGARIRPGGRAVLPDDDKLIGTLAHAVIEKLFVTRTDWPFDEAAAEAGRLFDALTPAIAAPLLRPGFAVEYGRAKARVMEAVRMLVGMLAEARLTVRGCEMEVIAPFGQGQEFGGRMDLVLGDERGRSVILDLKWNKSDKYRRADLGDNRALQLAAYVWLEEQAGRRTAGAGYLMLRQQTLLFSEPDPFPSSYHVSGTDLRPLWQEVCAVYEQWMQAVEDGIIVARGVEDPQSNNAPDPMDRMEPGCRFCDYRPLCGAKVKETRK
jgi:RecB family exonuclease